MMKIICISGLGADERVYAALKLISEIITIPWVVPTKDETIQAYSKRLMQDIDTTSEEIVLIGVSFGGLIATEVAKLINPTLTILISSVATKYELPKIYRSTGGLMRFIPWWMFLPPKRMIIKLFKAENKELLQEILKDTDPKFVKWAMTTLVRWQNTEKPSPHLKIGGDKDLLLPSKNEDILIKEGGHFMIVDKADEISHHINIQLANL